jgi:DnaJ-class molecular chaperone
MRNSATRLPIGFAVAALGADIEIQTPDAKVRVPRETQTGRVFRVCGKGIKGVRSYVAGDVLCHVVVETPVNSCAEGSCCKSSRPINPCGRRPPRPTRQEPRAGWTG